MKTKKIIAALLAGALSTTAVVSASAATLTDVTPEQSVEVTANIVDPGSISYVITIPDKLDFGQLQQPENEIDSYKFQTFDVEATELNILSNQGVTVYVKDGCSDFETNYQFCIEQKDKTDPQKFNYDVFTSTVDDTNIASSTALNSTATPGTYGYHFCTFNSGGQGDKITGTLALNQKALYGKELSAIAGDYSGNMLFHSALISLGG